MNAVHVYDWTYPSEGIPVDEMKKTLNFIAKKWCFQEEEGGHTKYKHYQIRLSLKVKRRPAELITLLKNLGLEKGHISITSDINKNNSFYVLKPDSRVSGPWTDEDAVPVEVPRQIKDILLREWQQSIADSADEWDTRHINVVVEQQGNVGKSVLCCYLGVHNKGRVIPPVNDYKDLMRMVMDLPTSKLYLVDIPRALDVKKASGIYSALEEIKSGHAWDDRYKFQEKWFDCPNIWVFTNHEPPNEYLSKDRWVLWKIENEKLIKVTK